VTRGRLLLLVLLVWPVTLVTPTGSSMSDSELLAAIRLVDDHTWTLSDEPDPKGVGRGGIYSGVAPGASAVAAPFYFVLRPVLDRFDGRVVVNRRFLSYYGPNRRLRGMAWPGRLKDVYLLQILLAALLVAPLTASFLVRLHRRLIAHGVAASHATAIVLAVGVGSMALYYSCMYSRQAVAYGLAWHAALFLARAGGRAPSRWAALAAGVLFGGALAVDYASVMLVALLLLFLLPAAGRATAALVLLPLAAALALTALYHQLAFGSPLATPYHFRFWSTPEPLARLGIDLAAFQQGPALGVNPPSLRVMASLCFGTFKGLFVYSPVLLLGLAGHVAGLRDARRRRFHAGCLLVFLCYLVFNSMLGTHVAEYGRHFWGGLSVLWGPRYLYAVLPFLACGLVRLDWSRRGPRMLCLVLLLVSCAFNILGAMFSDVVMSTYAFGPELRAPIAYVIRLAFTSGPRVPMLDVYGVPAGVQWAVLGAVTALFAVGLRALGRARRD
jgi:hypothetical protein